MENKTTLKQMIPVLSGFFVMGFIDIVGIASNYIKADFQLSDTVTNVMLTMVYIWFLTLSVPTGILMDKIGRKNSVLISMIFTATALLVPIINYSLPSVIIMFSLIGIGNTILQVSANPLLAGIVSPDRLASNLTFGQFIKAIASFIGPIAAGFASGYLGNWKLVLPSFAIVSLISAVWLYSIKIDETDAIKNKKATLQSCFALLKDKFILSVFFGIIIVVGIDVGLNITIPKYLMERTAIELEQAGLGISLYFAAKTAGTLIGAILLTRVSMIRFYRTTVVMSILAMAVIIFAHSLTGILAGVFIVGLSLANIFSIIYSFALLKMPEYKNEISGLMMMGIFGGAIIPPVMGVVSDAYGQVAALAVLLLCIFYLLLIRQSKTKTHIQ